MKNRIQLIILAAIASLGLSNCVDVHQVLKVQTDGSGTLEETMLVSIPEEAKQLTGGQNPLDLLRDEKALKERAAGLGEGVEFVSVKEIKGKDGASGLLAVYKFSDVTKVTLNPDAGLATVAPQLSKMIKKDEKQSFKFAFEKGDTSKLTVTTPDVKGLGDMGDREIDPLQLAMAGPIVEGMRGRITVKTGSKITKTNATHSDSESVTLVDLDVGELLSDPEKLKALSELSKEKDRSKVAAKMKELNIKGEAQKTVEIEFE